MLPYTAVLPNTHRIHQHHFLRATLHEIIENNVLLRMNEPAGCIPPLDPKALRRQDFVRRRERGREFQTKGGARLALFRCDPSTWLVSPPLCTCNCVSHPCLGKIVAHNRV